MQTFRECKDIRLWASSWDFGSRVVESMNETVRVGSSECCDFDSLMNLISMLFVSGLNMQSDYVYKFKLFNSNIPEHNKSV